MGYTHYWKRLPILDPTAFTAWSCDVGKVVDALPENTIYGPSGEGAPEITDTVVSFNGNASKSTRWTQSGDDSGETFFVPQIHEMWGYTKDEHGRIYGECKTNWKPYDGAVTAALILLAYYFPIDCDVRSDGRPPDWEPGLELARRSTGLDLRIPTTILNENP